MSKGREFLTHLGKLECPFTGDCAKKLRQRIHAVKARRGWSDFVLYSVMKDLGFGESLRELPDYRLAELLWYINQPEPRPEGWEYNKKARQICAVQHQAGWSDEKLRAHLVRTYQVTHLNLLTETQQAEMLRHLEESMREGGVPQMGAEKSADYADLEEGDFSKLGEEAVPALFERLPSVEEIMAGALVVEQDHPLYLELLCRIRAYERAVGGSWEPEDEARYVAALERKLGLEEVR